LALPNAWLRQRSVERAPARNNALAWALEKLPADRCTSAQEFGEAPGPTPLTSDEPVCRLEEKWRNTMATLNIKNMPDPLYAKLKERARQQRRSVAQEVTHILEQALSESELSLLELRGLGEEMWRGVDAVKHVAEERATWD
jgi:hypothetical protein